MRPSQLRFTIRQMLALTAIVAVSLVSGQLAYDRYFREGTTRGYYVGDLIGVTAEMLRQPGGGIAAQLTAAELPRQAAILRSSITPDVWWFGTRSVNPSPPTMCLVVRHTEEDHQQVAAWFKQRRDRLYGVPVEPHPP